MKCFASDPNVSTGRTGDVELRIVRAMPLLFRLLLKRASVWIDIPCTIIMKDFVEMVSNGTVLGSK